MVFPLLIARFWSIPHIWINWLCSLFYSLCYSNTTHTAEVQSNLIKFHLLSNQKNQQTQQKRNSLWNEISQLKTDLHNKACSKYNYFWWIIFHFVSWFNVDHNVCVRYRVSKKYNNNTNKWKMIVGCAAFVSGPLSKSVCVCVSVYIKKCTDCSFIWSLFVKKH